MKEEPSAFCLTVSPLASFFCRLNPLPSLGGLECFSVCVPLCSPRRERFHGGAPFPTHLQCLINGTERFVEQSENRTTEGRRGEEEERERKKTLKER